MIKLIKSCNIKIKYYKTYKDDFVTNKNQNYKLK